jgi:ribose/xylose/arabinose/galactoside ABC-type transport system permease subunit
MEELQNKSDVGVQVGEKDRKSWSKAYRFTQFLRSATKQSQSIVGLLLIVAIFSALSPTFRTIATYKDILNQSVDLGIIACGTTVILISGGLDLSVGSLLSLVSVTVGTLLTIYNLPVGLAILGGLIVGCACGFMNGLIQVITGIPAFIVTLGSLMVYRGLAEIVMGSKNLSRYPDSFNFLGRGYLVPITLFIICACLVALFLKKSKLGVNAYAIGGGEEIARRYGVKVKRNRLIYYTIGGFFVALAAIVQTAKLDFSNSTFGSMYELYAIAAVVIGGTSLFGGTGSVGRTIIGVLIMQSIRVGLAHIGVGTSMQRIAIGVIVIVAVTIDVFQRRRLEIS